MLLSALGQLRRRTPALGDSAVCLLLAEVCRLPVTQIDTQTGHSSSALRRVCQTRSIQAMLQNRLGCTLAFQLESMPLTAEGLVETLTGRRLLFPTSRNRKESPDCRRE